MINFTPLPKPTGTSTPSTSGGINFTSLDQDPHDLMRQDLEQKQGVGAKVGGFLKSVGNIFTSNTQKFGNTIGSSLALDEQQKMLEESNAGKFDQEQKLIKAISANKKAGKSTTALEKALKDLGGSVPTIEELNPTINKTTGQVLGEALGTGVEALSVGALKGVKGVGLVSEGIESASKAGKAKEAFNALSTGKKLAQIAKTTGKEIASVAPFGYGYDVSQNLQEGETGASAFKPGFGTAGSVLIPGAFGASKALGVIAKGEAPRVINSLIKPLGKDFAYGKNPGRTVSELGITANSMDELAQNISKARTDVGKTIGNASKFLSKGTDKVTVNAKKAILESLDEAMDKAASHNDSTVLNRLQDIRKALTQNLVKQSTKDGPIIVSAGAKKLNRLTYQEALELKGKIGDLTKFTGNASDDKAVNSTLKGIYGKIKDSMNLAADEANPKLAKQLRKLNEQYGDLTSAEIATKYRDKIIQRHNIISMSPTLAGIGAGGIGLIASGGATLPALLAGATGVALDKAFASTAFKTRLAKWLAKESPSVVENLLAKNPSLRKRLNQVVSETHTPIEDAIKKMLK